MNETLKRRGLLNGLGVAHHGQIYPSVQELSPWHPAHIKPVHIGVYERLLMPQSITPTKYAHWDGKYWGWASATVEEAMQNKLRRTSIKLTEWRGLCNPTS